MRTRKAVRVAVTARIELPFVAQQVSAAFARFAFRRLR